MTAIFDAISEPVSTRVAAGLSKIGLVLRSRSWKGAGAVGITPTQGHALALLREAPDGLRLAALSKLLGVSPPTASEAVGSLVVKRLVTKEPGQDKRSLTLKVTSEGEALAGRTAEWPEFLGRAIETLDLQEQAAFLTSLVKVIRSMQECGDIPVQRMCVTCRYFRPNLHEDPANPHHCAYVDAPFGDRHLRLNCAEQEEAPDEQRRAAWAAFLDRGGASPERQGA